MRHKKSPAWAQIGIFKPNAQNITTCILSKLLHRFQFRTMTKTTKYSSWVVEKAYNKTKMRTTAILKNRKMAIAYVGNGLTNPHVTWHDDAYRPSELGSPNLTWKCSTMSPGNTFILCQNVKGQGHEAHNTSMCRSLDGMQYCRLLRM